MSEYSYLSMPMPRDNPLTVEADDVGNVTAVGLELMTAEDAEAARETLDTPAHAEVVHIVPAPLSQSAAGTAGTVAYDTNYFYVCTATNTWKRVQIQGWS